MEMLIPRPMVQWCDASPRQGSGQISQRGQCVRYLYGGSRRFISRRGGPSLWPPIPPVLHQRMGRDAIFFRNDSCVQVLCTAVRKILCKDGEEAPVCMRIVQKAVFAAAEVEQHLFVEMIFDHGSLHGAIASP